MTSFRRHEADGARRGVVAGAWAAGVLLSVLPVGVLGAQRQDGIGPQPAKCEAVEMSREQVTLADGSTVYVEPYAFLTSNGVTLLAGTPTFLNPPGERKGPRPPRDAFLGVILRAGQPARVVPWPFRGAHYHALRAAVRPEGGFIVAGVETRDSTFLLADSLVSGHWVAEWDGDWVSAERLPATAERVSGVRSSTLLRTADGWAWALPTLQGEPRGAVLFEGVPGQWRTERIVTPATAAYVELMVENDELLAAVVEQDLIGAGDRNSIFEYRREAGQPGWRQVRLLFPGPSNHDPRARRNAAGSWALSWWTRTPVGNIARAQVDPTGPMRVLTLDSAAFDIVPVETKDASHMWVTHHAAPDTMMLRIYRQRNGGVELIEDTITPFRGWPAVEATAPDVLNIAGPLVTGEPPHVVSLILRYALRCHED